MGGDPFDDHSFFRVMLPGFRTKLAIPDAFCASLQRQIEFSDKAILNTVKGQWQVRFHKGKNEKFYFLWGWGDFVNHHGLKRGDFAVFEHKGEMEFDVDLFDHTACEKEYRQTTCEKLTNSSKLIDWRNITPQHEDPLEAAKAYKSNKPHFIVKMKLCHARSRRPYVNIPLKFARSNGLAGFCMPTINFTLGSPSGKEWPVEGRNTKNGSKRQLWLAKGWYEFYVSNNLKVGDVCLFELNAGMVLNVVIFAKPK